MNMKLIKKWSANALASTALFTSAMLVAACSEDSGKVAGGVAEETGIAQGSIVLNGSVQIMGRTLGSSFDSLIITGVVPFEIRDVRFCGLDSASFENTEECVVANVSDGSEYELKAENVNWRYGLLSVSGGWDDDDGEVSYHAVVDSKDSSDVNVNTLTSWKYLLAKDMVKSGASIANALTSAEGKILEFFGVFGEYERFEKMNLSGTTDSDALLIAAAYLLDGVSAEYDDAQSIAVAMLRREIQGNYIHHPLFWTIMGVSEPGEDFKDLVEKYVSNYISAYLEIGRCDSEKEGRVLTPDSLDSKVLSRSMKMAGLSLMCQDGFWSWGVPEVYHTIGSMTDTRDGRVYKTTMVTTNGKSQTWMAEDLKYELVGSSCYNDSMGTCDGIGRVYTWMDALQLDTVGFVGPDSNLIAEDEEIQQCVESLLSSFEEWAYVDGVLKYDSLVAYKECGAWGIMQKEILENVDIQNRQGVCPDGWRIPSVRDWNFLADAVGGEEHLALKLMKKNSWVSASIRTPAGKGLLYGRTFDVVEFGAVPNDNPSTGFFASIPSFDESDGRLNDGAYVGLNGAVNKLIRETALFDYGVEGMTPTMMAVRCIKAD